MRAELGLTVKQWQVVRDKVELFEVSPTADIASRQIDLAENARNKSRNIKGDLNNQMKMGIIIAKHTVYKLAERASDIGDPDMTARDRVMTLIRERDDFRNEVENLKRQRESREETPSNLEVTKEDG